MDVQGWRPVRVSMRDVTSFMASGAAMDAQFGFAVLGVFGGRLQRRCLSSTAAPPGLTAALRLLVSDDVPQVQTLRLGALRAISSQQEYVTFRRRQIPVYRTLEAELDAQVAAQVAGAKDAAQTFKGKEQDEIKMEEFASLTGAAAEVWREHGSALRRAQSLEDEVRTLTGGPVSFKAETSLFSEEELLSPATRQAVRRVRAAATLDGDLLLGHVFARYAFCDLIFEATTTAPWLRTVGYRPPKLNDMFLDTLCGSIDRVAVDLLSDDKQLAIYHEAGRAFELNAKIISERCVAEWRNVTCPFVGHFSLGARGSVHGDWALLIFKGAYLACADEAATSYLPFCCTAYKVYPRCTFCAKRHSHSANATVAFRQASACASSMKPLKLVLSFLERRFNLVKRVSFRTAVAWYAPSLILGKQP